MKKWVLIGLLFLLGGTILTVALNFKFNNKEGRVSQEQSLPIDEPTERIRPVAVMADRQVPEVALPSSGSDVRQTRPVLSELSVPTGGVSENGQAIDDPGETVRTARSLVDSPTLKISSGMVGGVASGRQSIPSTNPNLDLPANVDGKDAGGMTEDELSASGVSQQTPAEKDEEESVKPCVMVWRHDEIDTNGTVTVTYTIDVDETVELPNGLILSELIPPGWTIINYNVQPQAVNEKTRIAKWLFMENQVVDLGFFYQAEATSEFSSISDWAMSSSWYAYRNPYDGKPLEFYTIAY